ncbi:putative intracellular septation protein [Caenispirillum salinarum AK4]|uniref:Inner membrane-spanning protein YciB n=1 Tax=Caenispirillum salinarum AK4 TaxID=1238182 RepID=K9GQ16_9PROT|nr:septation protein A [Caenispirillum salinarum]EKV28050.1 putative intracellular septation protein [Caenispirillum salinarum AK4]
MSTEGQQPAEAASSGKKPMNQWLKLLLEVGPLVVFFVGNNKYGIIPATGAFIVATVVALSASWLIARKVPALPLISGIFVIGFGGLTVLLEDDLFIKLKPTIVNALFAAVLFVSLGLKRNVLKIVFDAAFHLTDEGWRKLTWRWAWFFCLLAVLNEIVWRSFDTDTWVQFKVFGIMPLTILFSLTLVPLLSKYHPENEAKAQG